MLLAEQSAIGNLIRELRQRLKLKQEKLADQRGVALLTLNHAKLLALAWKQIEGMLQ